MNNAIYTKSGKLRKNPPPRYVIRVNGMPVPERRLQKVNISGIGFLMGPYGEQLDDNPDYQEWMRLKKEHDSWIAANRIKGGINLPGEETECPT